MLVILLTITITWMFANYVSIEVIVDKRTNTRYWSNISKSPCPDITFETQINFNRGVTRSRDVLTKEFSGLKFRIPNMTSIEIGTALSERIHPIKHILISTSWRSGSSFLGELINQARVKNGSLI